MKAYSLPETGGKCLGRLCRMAPTSCWLALLLVVGAIGCRREATPAPDLILINGLIWTGDSALPEAEALAIRDGRITTIGSTGEVKATATAGARVIDLHRRRVVPGFNDAHWHLPGRRTADLAGAGDVGEMVRRLRAYAATVPADEWVTGRGWGPSDFPDGQPHRSWLDTAFPARPVVLTDRDGHQWLANRRALALARVSRDTPNPPNGRIVRDESGEATGLLLEEAGRLVTHLVPAATADEMHTALITELDKAATYGLTSLQIASGADSSGVRLEAYERALRGNALKVRLRVAVPFERAVTPARLAELAALGERHRGPLLSFGIAKGMLDGTVDAHTAAMLAPYADRPGTGLPMWTQEALDQAVAAYDKAGLQVALHAVGDRAIRMALDAFARAAASNATAGRRHRIEHAEVPAPEDLDRFRALGVIASTQPMFASPDPITLTSFAPALGSERAARADAFARFDQAGVRQAFGSDYPVFTMEVMRGVHTAVTRQLPDGTPSGGWYPANRIGVAAALRHYTADPAWASFEENVKGTLSPGRMADLVVLSDDPLAIPPARLATVKALMTMMGGTVTWESREWKAGQ